MLLREPLRQARIPPARARRLDARTQAERFVKNNFPAQVLCVERLGKVGDGHDGKFQPLALVNAHQANGVFVRNRCDIRFHPGLALRLDEFQKPEQSLPLKLVELLHETQKAFDVGSPLRPARAREQPLGIMRFGQHGFQTFRKRSLFCQFPPVREPLQKFCDFTRSFTMACGLWTVDMIQRRPKMHAFRRQPDLRQFVERQAGERRTQHGDGRNVLQGIVQQFQQAQQIQDFSAFIKSAALDHQRHARALKFLRVNFRLARRRTQQHRHVAPPGGTEMFIL